MPRTILYLLEGATVGALFYYKKNEKGENVVALLSGLLVVLSSVLLLTGRSN